MNEEKSQTCLNHLGALTFNVHNVKPYFFYIVLACHLYGQMKCTVVKDTFFFLCKVTPLSISLYFFSPNGN